MPMQPNLHCNIAEVLPGAVPYMTNADRYQLCPFSESCRLARRTEASDKRCIDMGRPQNAFDGVAYHHFILDGSFA